MKVRSNEDIREIQSITIRIDEELRRSDEYTILTWGGVGSYAVSEAGIKQCKDHSEALDRNMLVLEQMALSRDWTPMEKDVLRVFYKNNMRLWVRVEEAYDTIRMTTQGTFVIDGVSNTSSVGG